MQAYSLLPTLDARLNPSPLSYDNIIIHLVASLSDSLLVYSVNQPLESNDVINDHLYY
jgi:hypothetical protein